MYSPERRTALVLTGTGAHGAYHAGVLRALHEAGVKIDIVCGRGIGVAGAVFAAIDGASRLWDEKGLWRSPSVARLYQWRWPVRLASIVTVAMMFVVASPLVLVAAGFAASVVGLVLGMAGLESGARLIQQYVAMTSAAFAPGALPTWLPRVVTLGVLMTLLALVAGSALARWSGPLRRRTRRSSWWALVGAWTDRGAATRHFVGGIWDLLKGGASVQAPAADDLSRRFSDLLQENLGQPGFRELLLTVHDLDARRDLVFGLVREPFRRTLFSTAGAGGSGGAWGAAPLRRGEAFDLAGSARDDLVSIIDGALGVASLTGPTLVRFSPDTYWKGETHRLIDRPSGLGRLLEEAAAAGAEQVILVTAVPELPGPHDLHRPRLDPMGRVGEEQVALESAVLRDAVQHLQHRFRGLYTVRPAHNPIGPFDLSGAYDERSDRHHPLVELMHRGYEDAYREFIEPVVGTSGEEVG